MLISTSAKQNIKTTYKGFSLLEILIVIALLAGTMSITLPSLFRGTQSDLPRSIRQIGAMVDNLKFISITHNQPLQIVFDFDDQQCFILFKTSSGWERNDQKFKPLILPDGISFRYFKTQNQLITARTAKVNILPFGYIDQFQITLQNADNERIFFRTISILGNYESAQDENLFF